MVDQIIDESGFNGVGTKTRYRMAEVIERVLKDRFDMIKAEQEKLEQEKEETHQKLELETEKTRKKLEQETEETRKKLEQERYEFQQKKHEDYRDILTIYQLCEKVFGKREEERIAREQRSDTVKPLFVNEYDCSCGNKWRDTWTCSCNDKCPDCGLEIEPSSSIQIAVGPR